MTEPCAQESARHGPGIQAPIASDDTGQASVADPMLDHLIDTIWAFQVRQELRPNIPFSSDWKSSGYTMMPYQPEQLGSYLTLTSPVSMASASGTSSSGNGTSVSSALLLNRR